MTPGGVAEDLASPAAAPARPGSPGSAAGSLLNFVDRHLAVIFPLPAILLVLLLMVYPLVYTVLLSTRSYDLTLRSFRTVAFAHYLTVLTSERFWDAFGRTFVFTAMSVAGSIVLGMVMPLVLNRDFRYQLTCVGGHAPVFVAQKIEDNCFRIAGGRPGLEVSWQVTGIRQDPWAQANPVPPEHDKPAAERGSFLHPALYGQPEEKSVQWARYPKSQQPPPQLADLERSES